MKLIFKLQEQHTKELYAIYDNDKYLGKFESHIFADSYSENIEHYLKSLSIHNKIIELDLRFSNIDELKYYVNNTYNNAFDISEYIKNICKDEIDDAVEIKVERNDNKLTIYLKLNRFNDTLYNIILEKILHIKYLNSDVIENLKLTKINMSSDSHMHMHIEVTLNDYLQKMLNGVKNESQFGLFEDETK